MICTCIAHKTLEEILEILDDPFVEMAEIRLDLCPALDDNAIRDLFETCEKPLIATYRTDSDWNAAVRGMEVAAESGARYMDVSLDAPVGVSQNVQKIARRTGTRLIRSYHNFECTPSSDFLAQVMARCLRYGADIVKIVTTATSAADIETIRSLYAAGRDNLIAFALGDNDSRTGCISLGAPFTYASYDEPLAEGQRPFDKMHESVYGSGAGSFFRTDLEVPCSKSVAQRAILCAALAEGTSRLRGYTPCEDSESAIAAAKALGASVARRGDVLTITGIGPVVHPLGLESVSAGESGLLARMLIPVLSQINGAPFTVTGIRTLPERALAGASDIMAAFGVMLRNDAERQDKEIHVPVRVRGPIIPGLADISGSGGSQLISGLLMALPLGDKPSKVYVSDPKSLPYMFITIDILRKFGITVGSELEGNAEMLEMQDWSYCTGVNFSIRGGQRFKAADMDLEGDWSTAANFLVAGAVFGAAEVKGLDTSSLQADISILDILVDAGAAVSYDDEVVSVRKAPLQAFSADLSNAPDLFPIVAVLAAFCPGRTTLQGVVRLRAKECDRAGAIVEMLTGMGVEVSIEGDEMAVSGESYAGRCINSHLLKAGKFPSHSDHRMAMALKIASIGADGKVEIDNEGCVAKSYPQFFDIMD